MDTKIIDAEMKTLVQRYKKFKSGDVTDIDFLINMQSTIIKILNGLGFIVDLKISKDSFNYFLKTIDLRDGTVEQRYLLLLLGFKAGLFDVVGFSNQVVQLIEMGLWKGDDGKSQVDTENHKGHGHKH